VKGLYAKSGFRIRLGLKDSEFQPLRADFSSNDEHVLEVERYIRTVKERTRATYNTLPFKKIPTLILVEMAQASVFWLNNFPPTDGISDTMSPRYIVVGFNDDYANHCKLEFGAYAQVHEDHENTIFTQTTGALALQPSGNEQGGYYFTSLEMPKEVVDCVHVLGRRSKAS
jgi:hypothetical protein